MKGKNIMIFGIETYYVEAGDTSKDPLVILHGWGSSTQSWEEVIRELNLRGIHVIMPDLPGFGKTAEPGRPWNLNNYIEFIKTFSELLGYKKFFLAGHSFGGQIAIGFSAQNPQNLKSLILMSAARIAKRKKLKIKIFNTLTTGGKLIFLMPILSFIKPLVQRIWYKITGERDYYLASPLMKKTMRLVLGEEMGPKLKDIKTPTLIIWGEKDYVTPIEDGRVIQEEIRGSILHIMQNGGHDINIKQAKKVALEIAQFINKQ